MMKVKYKVNQNGKQPVGISLEDEEKVNIFLPIGYRIKENEVTSDNFKREIRRLLKIISKKIELEYEEILSSGESFSIISAINVIEDFIEYGLYRQELRKCTLNYKGRINWKKTINAPQLYLNEKIMYQNIYYEHVDYFAEKEIQEIQKYCLKKISETIGFLWNFSFAGNISKEFNKNEMLDIINKELKRTNQDSKTKTLKDLLSFVQKTNFQEIGKGKVYVKYEKFELIWQELVDIFGVKGKEKRKYYPAAGYYNLEDNTQTKKTVNAQLPDTIIKNYKEYKNYIFILDAKYYEIDTFPNQDSIFKQVRYEQYVREKNLDKKKKFNIINAFILPNHLNEKVVEIQKFYARLEESKEKIYVAYVDTKALINDTEAVLDELLKELVVTYNSKNQ